MSDWLYLTTIGLFLGTIVVVFGMRYFSGVLRARATLAAEGAYRRVAEQAAAAESETAAALLAIQAGVAEVRGRLAAIEKVLKDVE